jgi:hypothetical protein
LRQRYFDEDKKPGQGRVFHGGLNVANVVDVADIAAIAALGAARVQAAR